MRPSYGTRWILGFDSSCAECQLISQAIATACGRQLEVLPLSNSEVQDLRRKALGADAPTAPTLIEVADNGVRVWTGNTMGMRLARRLGVRSTLQVVTTLGELRLRIAEPTPGSLADGFIRTHFLRFYVGATVVSKIVILGRKPAFGAAAHIAARKWVAVNKHQLPQSYDEVIRYLPAYRIAIIRELSSDARGQLWVEQLHRYQATHPELSLTQVHALTQVSAVAADPATFRFDGSDRSETVRRLENAERLVVQAFTTNGDHDSLSNEIVDLFSTIGPQDPARGVNRVAPVAKERTKERTAAPLTRHLDDVDIPLCCCNAGSNWTHCGDCAQYSGDCLCGAYYNGCGFLGAYECDGFCANPSPCCCTC
jgi:hypothetical protein